MILFNFRRKSVRNQQLSKKLELWTVSIIFLSTISHVSSQLRESALVDHDASKVKFYLYPNRNDPDFRQEILFGDVQSLMQSSFKDNILTCFLTHGFLDDYKALGAVKDAYLKQDEFPLNIIVMDWSALSRPRQPSSVFEFLDILTVYRDVVTNVERVAERIAVFISMLVNNNKVTLDKIHLIGHSLGAHISGNTGKNIYTKVFPGMQVARVTGLDPAGPAFIPPFFGEARPMDPDDGVFVDSIHSDAGINGIPTDNGVVDFYPNGGRKQPGCPLISDCSHKYAILIYTASISRPFIGCQCNINFSTASQFQMDKCLNPCVNPTHLGPYCSPQAKGDFYLRAPNPP